MILSRLAYLNCRVARNLLVRVRASSENTLNYAQRPWLAVPFRITRAECFSLAQAKSSSVLIRRYRLGKCFSSSIPRNLGKQEVNHSRTTIKQLTFALRCVLKQNLYSAGKTMRRAAVFIVAHHSLVQGKGVLRGFKSLFSTERTISVYNGLLLFYLPLEEIAEGVAITLVRVLSVPSKKGCHSKLRYQILCFQVSLSSIFLPWLYRNHAPMQSSSNSPPSKNPCVSVDSQFVLWSLIIL